MTDQVERLATALDARYTIERELGSGGMATVYLAHDVKHDRKVAVKVLRPELAAALGHERFLNEIRLTANLQHPHIVPLLDSGDANGFLYYVMPFVRGETLRERLVRDKQLPIDEAVAIAKSVAKAIDYAHVQGIIHRDLKPENILLQDGEAVVADFGIALAMSTAGSERLTETGLSLGTPQYMSPEQIAGERTLDGRTDTYSLGAVLYEMLAGEPPFTGATSQAIAGKILTQPPTPLQRVRDSVHGHLDSAVLKALAKRPVDRFSSAQKFISTIDAGALTQLAARDRRIHVPRRWYGALGIGFVAVLLVLGVLRFRDSSSMELLQPRPLTSFRGFENHPAISRDGRRVVFTWDGGAGGATDLYVMLTDGGQPLHLTESDEDEAFPAWSPDGTQIAFLRSTTNSGPEVRITSSTGGSSRLLTRAQWSGVDWSPDAENVAVDIDRAIHLVSVTTGESRRITNPPDNQFDRIPAFSPDGSRLAFQRVENGSGNVGRPYTIPLEGGEATALTRERYFFSSFGEVDWSPDGREVLFSEEAARGVRNLWSVRASGGTPRPLLVDGGVGSFSIASLAKSMVFSRGISDVNVWRLPGPEAISSNQEAVIASTRWDTWSEVSPDGERIAFVSSRSGTDEIWVSDSDGSNPVQLTDVDGALGPAWSPDGRRIAFHLAVQATERWGTWIIDVQRRFPRMLVHGGVVPSWSRDGQWIYYQYKGDDETWRIWRIPADGGEPERITTEFGLFPREGPDGRVYFRGSGGIRAIRPGQDSSMLVLDGVNTGVGGFWPREDDLVYINWKEAPDTSALWTVHFVDGRRTRFFDLNDWRPPVIQVITSISVSPDGRWVYTTLLDEVGADLMLVNGLR